MKRRPIKVAVSATLLLGAMAGGAVLILQQPSVPNLDTVSHPFRVPWRVIATGGQGQAAWQLVAGEDAWGHLCMGLRNADSSTDMSADVNGCGFNNRGTPTQYYLSAVLADPASTPVVFGPLPSGAAGVRITQSGHPALSATAKTLPEGLPKGKFWIRVMPQTMSLAGIWSAQALDATGRVIAFQDY